MELGMEKIVAAVGLVGAWCSVGRGMGLRTMLLAAAAGLMLVAAVWVWSARGRSSPCCEKAASAFPQ